MSDPSELYPCHYCGRPLALQRYGYPPTHCQRKSCVQRYERERKRRYRLRVIAKALARELSA